MTAARALCLAGAALLLGACATAPRKPAPAAASQPGPAATARNAPRRSPYAPAQEDPAKRGNYTPGGLYAPDVERGDNAVPLRIGRWKRLAPHVQPDASALAALDELKLAAEAVAVLAGRAHELEQPQAVTLHRERFPLGIRNDVDVGG